MDKLTVEQKDYLLRKFTNLFFSLSFLCISEEHEGRKKIYIQRIREILDNVFEDVEDKKQIKEVYMQK